MTETSRPAGLSGPEAADCRLLAGLFRFVAGYFLAGPTEASQAVLADPQWRSELASGGFLVPRSFDDPPLPLQEHTRQFVRTFRVPGDSFVPPYEQAYRKGKATVDDSAVGGCAAVYEKAGYELDPFQHIQADHIGHQARFVSAILEQEATCLDRGDEEEAATVATWRTGFLEEHCSWWQAFGKRVAERGLAAQVCLVAALASSLATAGGED